MIQASTAFVQRADTQFSAKGGCVSCHLYIAFTTVTAVREKGIHVDEAVAATERQSIVTSLRGRENSGVQRIDGPGSIDGVLYSALALKAGKNEIKIVAKNGGSAPNPAAVMPAARPRLSSTRASTTRSASSSFRRGRLSSVFRCLREW